MGKRNCVIVKFTNHHTVYVEMRPEANGFMEDFSDDRLERDIQKIQNLFTSELVGRYYSSLEHLKRVVFDIFSEIDLNFKWELEVFREF